MEPFRRRTVRRSVRCVVDVVGVVGLQIRLARMSSDLEVREAAGRFVLLSTDVVVSSYFAGVRAGAGALSLPSWR